MVHDGRSGGVRSSGRPLTTRQPFLLCDLRGGEGGSSTLVLVDMYMGPERQVAGQTEHTLGKHKYPLHGSEKG